MTTRVRLVQEAGRRRVEVSTTQSSSSQYSRESLHPVLCLAWLQQLNFGQMFSNFSRNLKTLNKLKDFLIIIRDIAVHIYNPRDG